MDETPSSADESTVEEAVVRPRISNACIEIIEEHETFDWNYVTDGVVWAGTTFKLRLVGDELQKRWRRELTKARFERGQRYEDFNRDAFGERALDYAIVDWRGVKHQGRELPCERSYKMLLPERVKAEIIRVAVGKEAGMDLAEQRDAEKNG